MKTTPVIIAAAAFAICFASARCVRAGSCDSASRAERRAQLGPIIDAAALVHGLDPSLLYAIARVESGECADAVSHKGAAGLMQLMPDTASRFGVEDPFDPAQNALGAARLIDYLDSRWDGKLNLPEVLAAYNAGEGAVDRAGGIPNYPETREYVRRVLWLYLAGHIPDSGRDRIADSHGASHATGIAAHPAVKTHLKDADTALLEKLSEVRQAREQEEAGRSR